MKRTRFTGEQIIGMLNAAEARRLPPQSQACHRNEGVGSGACSPEPAVEPGLCARSDGVRETVPGLNIVDDVTRECLAAVPDTAISGRHAVRELTELNASAASRG